MRLSSYKHSSTDAIGVQTSNGLVDLALIDPNLPTDMTALLAHGLPADLQNRANDLADKAIKIDASDLLPVVPNPRKILCMGLNYADHAKEGNFPIPDFPIVFMRSATSLLGPNAPCELSDLSSQFDYEAELAVVIGKTSQNLTIESALDFIAGYSVFNDLSYRDFQLKGMQWTMGKNFDGSGPFGPALVTPDELPLGAEGLAVQCRLNGALVQDGNTTDMIFSVPQMLVDLSAVMTLEPGDVIITGTPAGVGMAHKPPLWLKKGDVVEVEIEGVGATSTLIL